MGKGNAIVLNLHPRVTDRTLKSVFRKYDCYPSSGACTFCSPMFAFLSKGHTHTHLVSMFLYRELCKFTELDVSIKHPLLSPILKP